MSLTKPLKIELESKSELKVLEALYSTINILNNLASVMIIIIAVWIFIDVSGRVLFAHPLVGTPEVAANLLAAIAFLQMPKVLRENQHIRSELVLSRVSSRGKEIIEIVSSLLGAVLFAIALVSNWDPMIMSWVNGEYEGEGALRVPSSPVKTIIMIGSALMLIQYAVQIGISVLRLTGRRSEQDSWTK